MRGLDRWFKGALLRDKDKRIVSDPFLKIDNWLVLFLRVKKEREEKKT